MKPSNEAHPANEVDWPSLVEFKQSRFPDYNPDTDADAEDEDGESNSNALDFVLPD